MKHQSLLRKSYLLACIFVFALCSVSRAQLPKNNWPLHYRGSSVDNPFVIKFTAGAGLIAAGYSDPKDGQLSTHANKDYWELCIIKQDRCAVVECKGSLGVTGYKSAGDIEQNSSARYGRTNDI